MKPSGTRRPSAIPVYVGLVVLVIISAVFVYELIRFGAGDGGASEERLTAETYMDTVGQLLADASVERGPELLRIRGCGACHSGENAGRLAPDHSLIADIVMVRLRVRRPIRRR